MTKEKGLTALLSLQASDDAAPELRSKGMDALQANHERPTNSYEEVHPFSTVHPHGPLARAEPKFQDRLAWKA